MFPTAWPTQRARFLFERRDVRGAEAPLASATKDGVILRSDLDYSVWNPDTNTSNYKLVEPDDFVIGLRSFQHGISHSTVRGIVSPAYTVLRQTGALDPRFVKHYFRSSLLISHLANITQGIRQGQAIDIEAFQNLVMPAPPLEEQRRIADLLDFEASRIDGLIARIRRQNALLTEREEASVPLAVAGVFRGVQEVETGIPWMPAMHPEARVVPLLRVLQLQRGADLTDSQRVEGSVPVVTTAGLSGWHNRALAEGPGVVIRRYGSRGNVHWVQQDYWPHNTTLYVKDFKGNDPRYCYHLLRALPYEMEQAKAAIPGVNRNDLHRLLVAVLPESLQRSAVASMDAEVVTFQAARERIQRLTHLLSERRQSLITAAVTGQFDSSTASGRHVTDGVMAL